MDSDPESEYEYESDDNVCIKEPIIVSKKISDYECCDMDDIREKQNNIVKKFRDIYNLDDKLIIDIMILNKWNEDITIDIDKYISKYNEKEYGECLTCGVEKLLCKNYCEHKFCIDCWLIYIEVNKMNDVIKCMECESLIDYNITKNANLKNRELSYIDSGLKSTWCTKCDKAIILNNDLIGNSYECTCDCLNTFCLKCKKIGHAPLQCKNYFIIDSKLETVFTKSCPSCYITIFKDGGCNHVTCTICKNYMCWLCGDKVGLIHSSRSIDDHVCDMKKVSDKNKLNEYMKMYNNYKDSEVFYRSVLKKNSNKFFIELLLLMIKLSSFIANTYMLEYSSIEVEKNINIEKKIHNLILLLVFNYNVVSDSINDICKKIKDDEYVEIPDVSLSSKQIKNILKNFNKDIIELFDDDNGPCLVLEKN